MIATLSRQSFEALIGHAERARPRECCGLLVGRGDPEGGERVEIEETVPGRNLAEDADRFWLAPVDHIRARREARARGLDVVGFYHSPPHSAARPSARDLAEAIYPDMLYVIVSLEVDPPVARAYVLSHGRFLERPLRVGGPDDRAQKG